MSINRLKIILTIASLLFLGSVFKAYAQTPTISVPTATPESGINLTLSPTFLNLATDPGKSVNSQFRVTNNNNFPEYLKLSVVKFVNGPQGPVIAPLEAEDEFRNWISFEENQFILNPNQNRTVNFTVSPPSSAALGYYYAIVVSRIRADRGEGAVVSGSPALPVLLEVFSPNAKKEAQIIDFKTSKLFYEYLPSTFEVTFKNTGNIHVYPFGDIFIDSMFNEDVGQVKVNEARGNILPGGERTFISTWSDGFPVRVVKMTAEGTPILNEKGDVEYETKYDFSQANKFRFGRYTANLLMVYDNGERDIPVEAQVSFWVIPWKIIGIAVIVIILVFVGLKSTIGSGIKKIKG